MSNKPAPGGFYATVGSGSITLTWNAVTNATSYNLYRATAGTGTFSLLTTVSTPGYTDNTVVKGTTYWYAVTAVNIVGESAQQGEASGVVPLPSGSTVSTSASGGSEVVGRRPTLRRIRTQSRELEMVQDALQDALRPVLTNPIHGAPDFRWAEIPGSSAAVSPTWALQYRTPGTQTWTAVVSLLSTGGLSPGTPAGAAQTGAVYQGSGVPSDLTGNNGDVYFRTDTPGSANQRIYIKSGGTWTGIV